MDTTTKKELKKELNKEFNTVCTEGNIVDFEKIIKRGPDLECKDEYGDTPLNNASIYGNTEIVKTLLKLGVNIESENCSADTPLWNALIENHLTTAKILLRGGANIEHVNDTGTVPLGYFSGNYDVYGVNDSNVARFLIDNDADINYIDRGGYTPLSTASATGSIEIMTLLLDKEVDNIDNIDKLGDTPLICAAKNEHIECVKLLLERGVDPHHKNKKGHDFLYYLEYDDQKFIEDNYLLVNFKPAKKS